MIGMTKKLDWILGEKSSQRKLQIWLRRKDKRKVAKTHLYSKYLIPLLFFVFVCLQWIIIPLLSSAVAQFKKYKSPRMKRYLSKETL